MADVGLWVIAASTPDQLAVVEPDGRTISYGELAARADLIGRGLQALGLKPGDVVAGLLPNCGDGLALTFAALETGVYVVPVNWLLAAPEVAYCSTNCAVAVAIAAAEVGAPTWSSTTLNSERSVPKRSMVRRKFLPWAE